MATLRDVAKRAGVSYTQASYVLNRKNLHCVRPDRQRRIRQAMTKLNYRPSRMARQMRRTGTQTIGLLLSAEPHRGSVLPGQIEGINKAAHKAGYAVSLLRLSDEAMLGKDLPLWMREICMDGLLIHYNENLPDNVHRVLESVKLPAIWLNDRLDHDCVHVDEFAAGRMATEFLIRRGHKRIAFVNPHELIHHSDLDRREAYERAMGEAGLEPQLCIKPTPEGQWSAVAKAVMEQPDPPTGLITPEVYLAIMARMIAWKASVPASRVPEIVTFHSEPYPAALDGVTVVAIPQEPLGHKAFEMLLEKIENPDVRGPSAVIDPYLINGGEAAFPT